MGSEVIEVLIVDDEAPARQIVRDLLEQDSDIRIVGEAWGKKAPEAIGELSPDLVYLDVQMPGMDGFEVLEALSPASMPAVVFVTAYDEYALRAFEVRAVDYLVKPFTDQRFREATARAKERLRSRTLDELRSQIEELLAARRREADEDPGAWDLVRGVHGRTGRGDEGMPELVLRDGSRTHLIRPGDIDWIEGAGTYIRIHEGARDRLVRTTLSRLADRLRPHGFFRIHRSSIVNLARVVELRHLSHGDYQVILEDGTRLRLARTRRESFEEVLEGLVGDVGAGGSEP